MAGVAPGVAPVCGGLAGAGIPVVLDRDDGATVLRRPQVHADMTHDAPAGLVARAPAARRSIVAIRRDVHQHLTDLRKDVDEDPAVAAGRPAHAPTGIAAGPSHRTAGPGEVDSTVNHMDRLTRSTARPSPRSREPGALVRSVSRFALSRLPATATGGGWTEF